MELKELQEKLNQKKRGHWMTIVYTKVDGLYKKTTRTTIRLVDYRSTLKGDELAKYDSKPHNGESKDIYLGNNILLNKNTGKARLQVFLTNCKTHQPKSVYEYAGEIIDKETYYDGTGKKPSAPTKLFNIFVEDIVAVF